MRYADVCVNTPLGWRAGGPDPSGGNTATFTYAVPDRLASQIRPGHLVWVPFRGQRIQAVVLALNDVAPLFDTREILTLVWAQPLLTPQQLALAHWVSDYYLAPLIEALRLMLPAGLGRRGRTVFVRTSAPAPATLSPARAALLAHIAEIGGTWEEVRHGLEGVTQKADLDPLIAAGLVTRETAFSTPPPRPKTDRRVRLLADPETVARVLPTLGHASKQADALAWLANRMREQQERDTGEVAPAEPQLSYPLEDLCVAVGCGQGTVKGLERRSWVQLERGRRSGEASMVKLVLPLDEVPDVLIALRGADAHRSVVEALQNRSSEEQAAWIGWIYAETSASLRTLQDLEAAGLVTVAEEMIWRDPLAGHEFTLDEQPVLTADQERVWTSIDTHLGEAAGRNVFLLYGVTGSGKTEIYLRAIAEVLKQGKQAVALVPEIALTPQTIRRFAARFPAKVAVWHSELGEGERFDIWRRVRTDHPAAQVVVGSRSALFLPFPRLGLIILDEEHEAAYKQERTPRYHARTVAIALGEICDVPVLFGSATPALESYYAARRGDYELLALPKRVLGHSGVTRAGGPAAQAPLWAPVNVDLPAVRVVDMRQELRAGNRSMFSRVLSSALAQVLAAGQQAILYLNRRGTATFVMCRDCGHVEACPRCAVPLTYHRSGESLLCHHCNRRYPVPTTCAECGGKRIRYFGSGTQTLEDAVSLEFAGARTLRWDRDVTGAKGSHDAILTRFVAHEADILLGTQMIAKGLDLPLVTLVGVIAADVGLFLPDFRASERTFQLLTQVAGRAGRSALGGKVIIQTYHPDHYAIIAASNHDYEGFYRQEMTFRREQRYPPVRRLAKLVYYHTKRPQAESEATRAAGELQNAIVRLALDDTDLIGPVPCFFSQQRGEYRWQVVVRSPDPALLLRQVPLPPGWRLDIDPVDLL